MNYKLIDATTWLDELKLDIIIHDELLLHLTQLQNESISSIILIGWINISWLLIVENKGSKQSTPLLDYIKRKKEDRRAAIQVKNVLPLVVIMFVLQNELFKVKLPEKLEWHFISPHLCRLCALQQVLPGANSILKFSNTKLVEFKYLNLIVL